MTGLVMEQTPTISRTPVIIRPASLRWTPAPGPLAKFFLDAIWLTKSRSTYRVTYGQIWDVVHAPERTIEQALAAYDPARFSAAADAVVTFDGARLRVRLASPSTVAVARVAERVRALHASLIAEDTCEVPPAWLGWGRLG